jgi:serine/threonine protein kinase
MLTGKRPYLGANVVTIIEAHRDNPIPRLPENLAHFQKVIDGLLAKNPEQRYPSVSAAVSELSRLKI